MLDYNTILTQLITLEDFIEYSLFINSEAQDCICTGKLKIWEKRGCDINCMGETKW
jgi:hypothetical protein